MSHVLPFDMRLRGLRGVFVLFQEKKDQSIALVERPVFWSVIDGAKAKGVGWSDEEEDGAGGGGQ